MNCLYFLATAFILTTSISCSEQDKKLKLETGKPKMIIDYMTSTDTTGQLMKEDDFWKIIDNSRTASDNDYQEQIVSLKQILTTLEPNEIEKFGNTFSALLAGSYDNRLWGAAYVINGGCSDDCFEYFREYLIAHGKEKFYATLQDPESCVDWIKSEDEDNWEGISYCPYDAYKQKTGKEIPLTYQPDYKLKGKPFDENTVHERYPKLARKS